MRGLTRRAGLALLCFLLSPAQSPLLQDPRAANAGSEVACRLLARVPMRALVLTLKMIY